MAQAAAVKTEDDFLADGHTPMMAQYHTLKSQYPDCLLFYRMGDFYELFFDDAEKAAAILDITLTRRGKTQGTEIPMAGVPFHSYEPYLARLIRAGHKVAICEQVETPEEAKKRGGHKALVARDVIRVVTPGTLTEDHLLEARENNYLAALAEAGGQFGLAWLEISTGEFLVQPLDSPALTAALEGVAPREILIPEPLAARDDLAAFGPLLTPQPANLFDSMNGQRRLESLFGVGALDGLGGFGRAEIAAAGALVDYVERTQKGQIPHLSRPRRIALGAVMDIDAATRRNLELTRTLSGERKGSLLSVIDRTVTGAGARLLQSRLSAPLTDLDEIDRRLDLVGAFVDDSRLREGLRAALKETPDMERALSRLSAGRGSPRDLAALRDGLRQAERIGAFLPVQDGPFSSLAAALSPSPEIAALADLLKAAVMDDPPALARDGGFIRRGFHARLDELKGLRENSRRLMLDLESLYKTQTGIDALKITHNNILGYYIEVPAKKADALLVKKGETDNPFVHRQTMASAVRFTTPDLSALERDMEGAEGRALAIELELFTELTVKTSALSEEIGARARALAALDVASGLADLAVDMGYTRPAIEQGLAFSIEGGRHPVVEHALRAQSAGAFTPNDCDLSPGQRLWLLTGPNMAGKSTFLRQNALIAILAQAGSFVPAKAARIGLVDRCFSRVGASDDLARGHSTFMVEMVETAAILNQATERSLVILDEIGRGTATFDGLSIAWACVEHLHEKNRCRALFATHYHELTRLQSRLPSLSCHSMQVREWKGDIVFLHAVGPGAADRSYGVHVARLAGLPPAVVARAQEVLSLLENGEQSGALARLADDLPLFTAAPKAPQAAVPSAPSPLLEKLAAINPDALTPREALELIYALKALSEGQ